MPRDIEAHIADAVARFQREQVGRCPKDVRAFLLQDMVLIRCDGVLTPTEVLLAATDEGRRLIRGARQELRGLQRTEIEGLIGSVLGCRVLRSYSGVDVAAGELVEVYILDINAEERFR